MLGFLAIVSLFFVIWFVWIRGALIAYKHKKDSGAPIPGEMDQNMIIDILKKDAMYPDIKAFYFDQYGNICVDGKYDKYVLSISDGLVFLDDPTLENDSYFQYGNEAMSLLARIGYWRIRLKRKNQRRIEEIECLRLHIRKALDHNAPINAYQQYRSMKRSRTFSKVICITCAILVVLAFSGAMLEDEPASENIGVNMSKEEQKIYGIKSAYLEAYSDDITVGMAFASFFDEPTWEYYLEDGTECVKFVGECTYNGNPALMVILFEFMENDWFVVSEIKLNGEKLNNAEIDYVLSTIYDNYSK